VCLRNLKVPWDNVKGFTRWMWLLKKLYLYHIWKKIIGTIQINGKLYFKYLSLKSFYHHCLILYAIVSIFLCLKVFYLIIFLFHKKKSTLCNTQFRHWSILKMWVISYYHGKYSITYFDIYKKFKKYL